MKRSTIYLILAIVGAVLPLSQFVPAAMQGEFSVAAMIQEMTATRTLTGISLDLMVAAITGMVFIVSEGIREKIQGYWIAIVGTVFIGFSFGLPFFLFLWQRKREIAQGTQSAA